MGTIRRADGVVVFQQEGIGEARRIDAGGLSVEFGWADSDFDTSRLFHGLPDDMCQCHHHGYVVRGQVTFKTKDGTFEVRAGEAYEVGPGHVPVFHAGSEWVQFTDPTEQRATDEAMRRNAAAAAAR